MEYVNNKADTIFIYASNECRQYTTDVFYQINNTIVKKHELNNAGNSGDSQLKGTYDVSDERQITLLKICNDNLSKIKELFQKYNKEMPTEMKLIYDVSRNKLGYNYS
ncbi:hypothetical protein [Paenibacillus xylaniclasticus]|uniref:hypothetical protein n=1 Tax=Paenibacillus xylaniclasticus TaxID=588083 RepID=UPI00175115AF|nr:MULTISPECIES: hypothetical protein [Paenibacillus]GFN31595.1 hypothetical protein PCURB6_18550 [Paenibacillus curdlanolyticus]